jgi:hypothetical protein
MKYFKEVPNEPPMQFDTQVWCRTCGFTQTVSIGDYPRGPKSKNWPKCCGIKLSTGACTQDLELDEDERK